MARRLPGLASGPATLKYSQRGGVSSAKVVRPDHFRAGTGPGGPLVWSSLGMGTNLGNADDFTVGSATAADTTAHSPSTHSRFPSGSPCE